MPLDATAIITRVACGDATDPVVVAGLLAPGDCGRIWVAGEDFETLPPDFRDWKVYFKFSTTTVTATNPQYVPTGAPGAPPNTWCLDFTVPAAAKIGSYRAYVQYSDAAHRT